MTDVLATHAPQTVNYVALNALCVWMIEKLKGSSKVPWVEAGKDKLLKSLSLLSATLGAAGIDIAAAHAVGGGYSIHIAIPSLAALLTFLGNVIANYAAQKVGYHLVYKGVDVKQVVKTPLSGQEQALNAGQQLSAA